MPYCFSFCHILSFCVSDQPIIKLIIYSHFKVMILPRICRSASTWTHFDFTSLLLSSISILYIFEFQKSNFSYIFFCYTYVFIIFTFIRFTSRCPFVFIPLICKIFFLPVRFYKKTFYSLLSYLL